MSSLQFSPTGGFPQKTNQLVSRLDAGHVQNLQTLCRLSAHIFEKSLSLADHADSMVHWASYYRTVGRCRTFSAYITESRMKTAVKTKARKTNNQASIGYSRPTWRWRRL